MARTDATSDTSKKTALHAEHVQLGAKMVPFAGYEMPLQYPQGIIAEHRHTRAKAGLFDVSHMGQLWLKGPDHLTVAQALETVVPADIVNLKPGRQRYSQLLNEAGGIVDDLMISRPPGAGHEGSLLLVLNAARKAVDIAYLKARLPAHIDLEPLDGWALLALQGPGAEPVLERIVPGVAALGFMDRAAFEIDFGATSPLMISRSGYSGEDGYEISLPADKAPAFWRALLEDPDVAPIGLGARDSLRLEAGLCLYGHDLDETTSPIEAGLSWSIQKRRRQEGGFPGAGRIQRELDQGPGRCRVGIKPVGRAPARDGTIIQSSEAEEIGLITSGGFGPSVDGPIAMGYVTPTAAAPGTEVSLIVRGKPVPAQVVGLPFIKSNYKR